MSETPGTPASGEPRRPFTVPDAPRPFRYDGEVDGYRANGTVWRAGEEQD
jgi:hypothetical protein